MKTKCEIYSRIVGYLRPVNQWNEGKVEEFKDRKSFEVSVTKVPDDSQKLKISEASEGSLK